MTTMMMTKAVCLLGLAVCLGCSPEEEDMASRRERYHAELVARDAARQKNVDRRKQARARQRQRRGW
jgi:hypothetical protein